MSILQPYSVTYRAGNIERSRSRKMRVLTQKRLENNCFQGVFAFYTEGYTFDREYIIESDC